jgi:hypothetical protein
MGSLQHSIVRMSCVLAAVGAVSLAPAQGTAPAGGNPLFFSSPAGNGLETPADLGKPRQNGLGSADQVQAPHSLDSSAASDLPLLMPPPNNALREMSAETRKNWTEMTPAEILGVQLPEETAATKLLNSQRKDADLPPLENYLRLRRLEETGTTNLARAHEDLSFLDERNAQARQMRDQQMRDGTLAQSQIFNRLLQNVQGRSDLDASGDQDRGWGGGSFSTLRPNQPTPQKVDDMKAFLEALSPTEPAKNLKSSAWSDNPLAPGQPSPDSFLESSRRGNNSAGNSFQSLDSGLGRPNRLTPLPGLNSDPATPSLTPAWAPQPPPWTLDKPQLFVNQVRKF